MCDAGAMVEHETTSVMDDLLDAEETVEGGAHTSRRHWIILGTAFAVFALCALGAVLAIRASFGGDAEGTVVPWRDAAVAGTSVTVTWDASPCAQSGETTVVETAESVEITVREVPRQALCSSPGEVRTTTVELDGPVDGRVLVDGAVG